MANKKDTEQTNKLALTPVKMSRRGFLKATGAVGGAVALGSVIKPGIARANEDFTGYPDRFGMLTDTTKCVGCRQCEAACAKANNLPKIESPHDPTFLNNKKRRPSAQAFTVVNKYTTPDSSKPVYRKLQCMHCNEPACASACLVAALKKTPEGPVIYREDVCIGCRYCMVACPFNMLSYDYASAFTPAVKKCIMCYSRVRKEGGVPACVEACPTKATIFGKRSDLIKIARDRIHDNPGTYVDHIYGEYEAGGTGWLYLSAVPFEQLGLPGDLGRTPYPEYTRNFLVGVPLVLMMWPPLLAGLNALFKRRERLAAEEAKAKEEERR